MCCARDLAVLAAEVRGDDREVLLALADAAGLLHRVGEAELLRPQRPRRAVVGTVLRRLGQQLELHDRQGALADRVADAVRAGVAAADDDDVLARRGDPAGARAASARGSGPSCVGDPAVAHVEVVHREVDAVQLAARAPEVARDARADRQHDRVELLAQLVAGDVDADVHAAAQLDALVDELLHAALDDALLDLEVRARRSGPARPPTRRARTGRRDVPGAPQLLGGRHAGRTGADDRDAAAGLGAAAAAA